MSLVVKKSSGGGIHIDEGDYVAIIEAINLNKGADGNEYFAWDFKVSSATIDDDPVKGDVRIRGFANALLTPKSKLSKWAKGAGIDVENESEEEIDLQDAIGASVKITVEDHETKDGATVSRVMRIRPAKPPKKAKDDDDEEEERPAKKEKKAPPKEEKKAKKKAKPVEEDEEEDLEEEDEDEEEEKPAKKKGKEEKKGKDEKKSKKAKDEDDEEDEDLYDFDDDEDADDDD